MREAFRGGLRSRGAALALLTLVCASAFIGRSVNTSDGAEVVSESLGLFVQGHPGFGRIPAAGASTPESAPPAHSKYGLYASLLPLPTLGPAWLLRRLIGASVVDALTALTWSFGTALAALAFGSLVRALRPGATGPWEVAFVAGTFLWPYAADSFVEPFAAAGLAAGAAFALSGRPGVAAAAPWAAACLLKPILWVTVPVFLLSTALDTRRARSVSGTLPALGVFAAALCLHGLGNRSLYGSLLETGYGEEILRFTTPLGDGLFGLLFSPGRSIFLYAPVAAVGLLGLARASRPAKILCAGAPLVLLFVVARWWSWEGGASWGPRHLLPVLPLLVAPAVLVSAGAVRAAFVAGAFINLPGVLVAPGSWDGYAERLRPPAGASWPAAGPGPGGDDSGSEPDRGPRLARRAEPRRDRAPEGVARGRYFRGGSAADGRRIRLPVAPPARDGASAPLPDDPPPPRPFRGGVPRAGRSREGRALGASGDAPLSGRPGRRPSPRVRRGAASRRGEPLIGARPAPPDTGASWMPVRAALRL